MSTDKNKRKINWECPVCFSVLDDRNDNIIPCILSGCGSARHPICFTCALRIRNSEYKFKCPTCRKQAGTIMPMGWLVGKDEEDVIGEIREPLFYDDVHDLLLLLASLLNLGAEWVKYLIFSFCIGLLTSTLVLVVLMLFSVPFELIVLFDVILTVYYVLPYFFRQRPRYRRLTHINE